VVTEETVETSCEAIGGLAPQQARAHMMRLGRRQRELLAFVTTMTEDLSVNAQDTAIYAFVVICHMFEHSQKLPLARATRRPIAAAYERINDELGRLVAADARFLERHARVSTGQEPFVMRYVSEVLLEPDDPQAALNDDEIGDVFICLKTVVDVLHEISERTTSVSG
jgi:hypothetical protein